MEQAELVGWVCLLVGVVTLLAGVYVGLNMKATVAPQAAQAAVNDAKEKVVVAKAQANETVRLLAAPAGLDPTAAAGAATAAAGEATEAADSAIKQIEDIIGSLPENVRFAGLLVLVGTLLMSVATIQFGGVSLF